MFAHMTPMAGGKKRRVMTKIYDAHLMSIAKLSPRIGFCNVSINTKCTIDDKESHN